MNDAVVTTKSSPDHLSIIVYSGYFDHIHYALVMASAATAVGRKATLFFTMKAIRALTRSPSDGVQGWSALPLSHGNETARQREHRFKQEGLGTFEDLFDACQSLGVTFMVCELGLMAEGLTITDLRDDITITAGGAVTFIKQASSNGAMLFI